MRMFEFDGGMTERCYLLVVLSACQLGAGFAALPSPKARQMPPVRCSMLVPLSTRRFRLLLSIRRTAGHELANISFCFSGDPFLVHVDGGPFFYQGIKLGMN
jgi:hypothetical protein